MQAKGSVNQQDLLHESWWNRPFPAKHDFQEPIGAFLAGVQPRNEVDPRVVQLTECWFGLRANPRESGGQLPGLGWAFAVWLPDSQPFRRDPRPRINARVGKGFPLAKTMYSLFCRYPTDSKMCVFVVKKSWWWWSLILGLGVAG